LTCEATTEDRISLPLRTTAAAVSSQLVSMPNIVTVLSIICAGYSLSAFYYFHSDTHHTKKDRRMQFSGQKLLLGVSGKKFPNEVD
jgi:hypothetical protein